MTCAWQFDGNLENSVTAVFSSRYLYNNYLKPSRQKRLHGLNSIILCLDIPVPRCVQKLISEPPVCLPNKQDIKAVNLIRNFGNEFGRQKDEIDQACSLASGQSDLVILLERPHKSQTYRRTFGDFVKRCETLKRVNKLIRFSSKGARSIHTVTVLDAFSFKPEDSTRIPSERCHQLIEEI
ncbi:hypothetical protein FOXYSP1_20777 [Fusarium oxysporum f. sp. phaseoli]